MEDNETLEETASPVEEPVQEAVAETPVVDTPEPETPEASPAEQPSRQWAGKYQSPEDLERAYLESQREASRMAGELAATKRAPTTPSGEPKYKALEAERNKWAQYLRNPNLSEQERWQADEQVRLHDREIAYERATYDFEQRAGRQSAAQQLETEARQVLQQYQDDLNNMSSPLYQAASQKFEMLKQAGYPDNDATKILAITYAAATNKTGTAKAIQQDQRTLAQRGGRFVERGLEG